MPGLLEEVSPAAQLWFLQLPSSVIAGTDGTGWGKGRDAQPPLPRMSPAGFTNTGRGPSAALRSPWGASSGLRPPPSFSHCPCHTHTHTLEACAWGSRATCSHTPTWVLGSIPPGWVVAIAHGSGRRIMELEIKCVGATAPDHRHLWEGAGSGSSGPRRWEGWRHWAQPHSPPLLGPGLQGRSCPQPQPAAGGLTVPPHSPVSPGMMVPQGPAGG